MEINITTQEDELIVSLKVDWENRKIEVIQDKDYKVTEVFADQFYPKLSPFLPFGLETGVFTPLMFLTW